MVRPRIERLIQWVKPERGWCKIKTGASSIRNPGKASGGGVFRAENGAWIKAYSRNVGHSTSLLPKLWALRDGLSMCIDLGINALIIESDAKVAVDLLNDDSLSNAANAPIVVDCRLLLS